MKKKLAAALLALLCLLSAAQAETFTLNQSGHDPAFMSMNLWYEAETFDASLPDYLLSALDASPFAGDPVLCGATLRSYYFQLEGMENVLASQAALIAVEHNGSPMLLGAARDGVQWKISPQSETFLRRDEAFAITVMPNRDVNAFSAMLAVVYGDEAYLISAGAYDEPWSLYQYQRRLPDGSIEALDLGYGSVSWCVYTDGRISTQESYVCLISEYLEAISADTLPRTAEALDAWAAEHPIQLAADEGYMGGANLRREATSSSRSYGQYRAGTKVQLLGQAAGKDFPWYHVRIGQTEGWVSGAYFYTEALDRQNLHAAANRMHPVARVKQAASLLSAPGGSAMASLPAGTEVTLLVEDGGWAHVVVPHNELTWQADWDGDYGYLPLNVLTRAASPLQLRYAED